MTPIRQTILVVDDDEMNRDGLSRRLIRAGYAVLTAAGGPEALELLNQQRIDAVLLDVMMPGMSGIDTLRRLRESRSLSELPVIMVTARDGSDDIVEALELGANDYVTKPIDFPVVLARIRTQVTARRADPLTGLPNRVLFMERLNRLVARSHNDPDSPFAVLFFDVDRFKVINDSLGHLAGDELLIGIARRLESCLRSTDTVSRLKEPATLARLGGDEFTVLLDGVREAAHAQAVAERIRAAMATAFPVEGREVVVSVSIGAVMSAPRYRRAEEMVRDADTAMYRAKELGKARCEVFDESMLAAAEQRLELELDLRHALERQEFEVYYQPIVALAANQLWGFEALLRWHHPRRGLVSPSDFIPTAEETGLIISIGNWVLLEACRQIRRWDAEFGDADQLVMSVNLSARQCMKPGVVADVANVLRETGLPATRLKLEITEGVVLENSDAVVKVLHDLRDLGVQLGLDDFGMGYSALSYLQRFPFQTLKIDRSFVSGIKESGNDEIIRSIVSLAAGLAMNVTAEGVETVEQMERLKELACEFGQGFYFYRPLTSESARTLLEGNRASIPPQALLAAQ